MGRGELLLQVEDFRYLRVLFTCDGRSQNEVDRQIRAVTAVMQEAAKRNLSLKAKLSIYKSICVPTLNYGHELWVVTERRSTSV